MAKKRKSDRPSRINICYDQILYDLDFMSNEYAGIILKMIVWYSAGTEEGKKHLEEMERYIDTLSDRGWLTSVYKRLFKRIDEDFGRYEDICEKRRQAVAKREEYKRNQMLSNDNNSNQEITNDNKCSDLISNTNTNTNTKLSKDNNNIYSSSSSSIACAREEIVESKIWEWQKSDLVTKQKIPPLTDIWIEEVQRLVERFVSKKISEAEIKKHYEDFKVQEATEVLQEPYSTWRKHFNNYVRKTLERQNENGTSKANRQYLSRDEQREREDDARKQKAARHIDELLSTCT